MQWRLFFCRDPSAFLCFALRFSTREWMACKFGRLPNALFSVVTTRGDRLHKNADEKRITNLRQISTYLYYLWPSDLHDYFLLWQDKIFFGLGQVKRSFQNEIFFGSCFGLAEAKNNCAGQVTIDVWKRRQRHSSQLRYDLHNYFSLWQNKIFFGLDRSKDHSKTKYFLGFVLILPKQKIIVQIRLRSVFFPTESSRQVRRKRLDWVEEWERTVSTEGKGSFYSIASFIDEQHARAHFTVCARCIQRRVPLG